MQSSREASIIRTSSWPLNIDPVPTIKMEFGADGIYMELSSFVLPVESFRVTLYPLVYAFKTVTSRIIDLKKKFGILEK